MDLLISKTRWHVAGYRHNDPIPRPVCGASGTNGPPWRALFLPDNLCGNCVRICRLDEATASEQSGDTKGALDG